MAKVLIVYYSRTGNTERMARIIEGRLAELGNEVSLKKVADAVPADMKEADCIIAGSPTYYGAMARELKGLLDESVSLHGRLDGKIGGAFSSVGNIAGGGETTVLNILNGMLVHGFIVQGDPKGSHYGPVSVGRPDKRAESECARFAERMEALLKRCIG